MAFVFALGVPALSQAQLFPVSADVATVRADLLLWATALIGVALAIYAFKRVKRDCGLREPIEAGWQQPASFSPNDSRRDDERSGSMTAQQIQTIGNALAVDLVAWGTAAIGLALVAAGAAWVLRLLR
jgi:hypothetical protein